MQLRWYQEEAIGALFQYFSVSNGNPLIAMPTGTGKSLVIAEFVHRVVKYYPGQRVMMLTHVKELIVQNMQKLMAVWPTAPAGIYSAGLNRRDLRYPITFAGIGSVHNRANQFGHIDLVIIDEAHLVSTKGTTMYRSFLSKLKAVNPYLKVIGLTATPYRLGSGMLTEGGLFTDVCYDITDMASFNRLVAEGYMSPLIARRTNLEYDIQNVRLQGDDLNQTDLQEALDIDSLTYSAVKETIENGHDRRQWLIFASGIQHIQNVRDCFDSFGVPVTCVHSDMDDKERDHNIEVFKNGQVLAMVNNNILTTGHDFPYLDLISVMTVTMSPNKWVQMLGRGTRIAPMKRDCLVLDFGKNTQRLGPINDPVVPRKKGKGGGIAPVRICPSCNTYNHASARQCVNCGMEFPRELKIEQQASTHEVMKNGLPVLEDFKVNSVVYVKHKKPTSEYATLKVTYFCGLRLFTEYVCLEHPNFASKKARDWWRGRCDIPPPATIDEAMTCVNSLREPKSIKVWMNAGKHPEVLNYEY